MALFNKLEEQSKTFNTTVLNQVANNIDFIYRQYSMSFTDIVQMDNFKKLTNQYNISSPIEEAKFIDSLGEMSANPSPSSITRNVTSKFQGAFFIAELDKMSFLKNTDHALYSFSVTNNDINVKKLTSSRLFDEAFKSGNNFIFGKPEEGIITGYDTENLQMFLRLYKPEENMEKKDIKKILFLITPKNFLPDLYKDIDNLKYGTLYILDQFDNILSYNHPSFRDDYEYNERLEINEYINVEINKFLLVRDVYPEINDNVKYIKLEKQLIRINKVLNKLKTKYNRAVSSYMNRKKIFPTDIIFLVCRFYSYNYFNINK
jgi:hypothetical protein